MGSKRSLSTCLYRLAASLANFIAGVALFGAGCILYVFKLGIVAESIFIIICIRFSAGASISGVALFGACRLGDHCCVFIRLDAAGNGFESNRLFVDVSCRHAGNGYFGHSVSLIQHFELQLQSNSIVCIVILTHHVNPNSNFSDSPSVQHNAFGCFVRKADVFEFAFIIR